MLVDLLVDLLVRLASKCFSNFLPRGLEEVAVRAPRSNKRHKHSRPYRHTSKQQRASGARKRSKRRRGRGVWLKRRDVGGYGAKGKGVGGGCTKRARYEYARRSVTGGDMKRERERAREREKEREREAGWGGRRTGTRPRTSSSISSCSQTCHASTCLASYMPCPHLLLHLLLLAHAWHARHPTVTDRKLTTERKNA